MCSAVHRDDDIPPFVPVFHIAMSLSHLFQGIASIDDRMELSRLNQLSEKEEMGFPLFEARGRKDGFFTANLCGPHSLEQNPQRKRGGQIDAGGRERAFTTGKGTLADGVKDDVIGLPVCGKILFGVINDGLGSLRLHQRDIRRTTDSGHASPKGPGELDCSSTDCSSSTIDQDCLPRLKVCLISQEHQGG